MNSTVLVIFGATGDLMSKKIVPALFHLYQHKKLSPKFQVVGFSRRSLNDEKFRQYIFKILKDKKLVQASRLPQSFLRLFHFEQGSFDQLDDYRVLDQHLKRIDKRFKVCSNKLYYLAVPPIYIDRIVKNLAAVGLHRPCGGPQGWARLLVEKPFGHDLQSARRLEKEIGVFQQEQIFRIDHYYGKEMVQGIFNFRFANDLLESSWNNQRIDKIEMKLWEKLDVADRGQFYESVGALRDVGQNHLLSMLSLLTMDSPGSRNSQNIRSKREEVLKTLQRPTLAEVKKNSFRAQYRGYRNSRGVKSNSRVETYFKIKVALNHPRWQGVPIWMESGKSLGEVRKEIVVHFRHPRPCLCPPGKHVHNKVVFTLQPHPSIVIYFWAKRPGFAKEVEERRLVFSLYEKEVDLQYVEEYATLLLDAIAGDQTWFVSQGEVQAMWRVIDPIVRGWQKDVVPLLTYPRHSLSINAQADNFLMSKQPPSSIGVVGLGKMGGNIARRLLAHDWKVVGYNRSAKATKELEKEGMSGVYSLQELAESLSRPRVIWLMVPAGKAVDQVLFGRDGLVKYLDRGDLIIDGGNSFYKNSIRRARRLNARGIRFLDCGVSGGPVGALNGACLMIGGEKKYFLQQEKLFSDLAQVNGYQFFAGSGAGHFVKMVHNGIEYGMMQAIAEGFAVMKKAKFDLDLKRVAEVYNNGSVIESRLLEWLRQAFYDYGDDLREISGQVSQSGEGQWTVDTAHELLVRDKVIHAALNFRKYSQKNPSFSGQVVSALRGQFGQHPVFKK